ncbi:MAG: HEAT repeat domain-containing protein, partial [Clostridia bacterium]|nr:HEAT repeat domain-containing protein [Clostridia bacterium]
MKLSKKVLLSSLMVLFTSLVFAQEKQVQRKDSKTESETSVESEYLNDVDGDIIITLDDD